MSNVEFLIFILVWSLDNLKIKRSRINPPWRAWKPPLNGVRNLKGQTRLLVLKTLNLTLKFFEIKIIFLCKLFYRKEKGLAKQTFYKKSKWFNSPGRILKNLWLQLFLFDPQISITKKNTLHILLTVFSLFLMLFAIMIFFLFI